VHACPKVAALLEATPNDSQLKRYAALDVSFLDKLGVASSPCEQFVAKIMPSIKAIEVKRANVAIDQMKTLSGDCGGLSELSVKELRKRLHHSCQSGQLFEDLLMVGFYSAKLTKAFKLKEACELRRGIAKAADALAQLKEQLGTEAVRDMVGSTRLDVIESYIKERSELLEASLLVERQSLQRCLEECVATMAEKIEVVTLLLEKEPRFMEVMKADAKWFAEQKKEVERLTEKVEAAYNATGKEFQVEQKEAHKNAYQASGCTLFLIAFFTLLTLYRSSHLGKKTPAGKATADNLKKVLESINANRKAVAVEVIAKLPVLGEMRKFAGVPLKVYPLEIDTLPPALAAGQAPGPAADDNSSPALVAGQAPGAAGDSKAPAEDRDSNTPAMAPGTSGTPGAEEIHDEAPGTPGAARDMAVDVGSLNLEADLAVLMDQDEDDVDAPEEAMDGDDDDDAPEEKDAEAAGLQLDEAADAEVGGDGAPWPTEKAEAADAEVGGDGAPAAGTGAEFEPRSPLVAKPAPTLELSSPLSKFGFVCPSKRTSDAGRPSSKRARKS